MPQDRRKGAADAASAVAFEPYDFASGKLRAKSASRLEQSVDCPAAIYRIRYLRRDYVHPVGPK